MYVYFDNDMGGHAPREAAVLRLRLQYGMLDPATLEPLPMATRYLAWLERALRLDFAGPGADPAALWSRFTSALPVTLLLGGLALLLAVGLGAPLGARLGAAAGAGTDRAVSRLVLLLAGLPEYLVATLLLLSLAGAGWNLFPSGGLASRS